MDDQQLLRYSRHILLDEIGIEGQQLLRSSHMLVIGAGGLGCPISLYLAAAGVGTIGLADVDVVSPSNLQRQVLFGISSIGEDKVRAAAKRLKDVNPDCNVIEHKSVQVRGNEAQDALLQFFPAVVELHKLELAADRLQRFGELRIEELYDRGLR